MRHLLLMPFTRYRKCIALTSIAIGIAISGNAQHLSLYDAVQRSLEHYPAIQQARMQVSASKAHLTTVRDNSLPSLTLHDQLDAGTANGVVGSYFPLGLIPSTSGGTTAHNNSEVATGNVAASVLQWDVYNFGYISAQKQEARAAVGTSEARLNSAGYLLTEKTVLLYLDLLRQQQLLAVQRENITRAATLLGAIRAHVVSGLLPGVDSSVAHAEYANARINYLQTYRLYMNDKSVMAQYTGMDTAAIVPDTAVLASIDNFDAPTQGDSVASTQPLLYVYEQEYQQQLAANRAYVKKNAPKLSLLGAGWMRGSGIANTGTYGDMATGLNYSRYNYLVGAAVSYNIVDIKQRHDRAKEAQYLAGERLAALQTAKDNLNTALQQADIAYATAKDKLRELPPLLRSARQAYTQQLTLFNAGLNTIVDVTTALYTLDRAETDQVIAESELLQALYARAALADDVNTFLQHFK
jgi:adhesin transport system outer membrane protein